ncbi:ABC transporter substrate-binding protein, partial [Enterobacter asburiae]|nr:ABC transporter substrate-binding protein [Enterobacter asburiae]
SASAAAKVVANFLLSPQAQIRKADPAVWGDPSVLDSKKLSPDDAKKLSAHTADGLPEMLPEPHAAWVDALEQEWLRRYGTR